jgi:hypothetical protein
MESIVINQQNQSQEKWEKFQIYFKRTFGKKLAFLSGLNDAKQDIHVKITDTTLIKCLRVGDIINVKGVFTVQVEPYKLLVESNDIQILSSDNKIDPMINKKRIDYTKVREAETKALCKQWKNKKSCNLESCSFRHFYLEGEENKINELKKRSDAMFKSSHENDPLSHEDKMSKSKRNLLYAQFLVDTFGLEYLKSGPILDVAGGKGLTSFFLTKLYGLNCIVIDPRGVTLPKSEAKELANLGLKIPEIRKPFDDNFDIKLIMDSSLIFGMHPDEATEIIVKIALQFKKSFSVVPCCVFPTLFANRQLKNGKSVVIYEELITYLEEMIDDPQKAFLNFKGRNKVLFKKL